VVDDGGAAFTFDPSVVVTVNAAPPPQPVRAVSPEQLAAAETTATAQRKIMLDEQRAAAERANIERQALLDAQLASDRRAASERLQLLQLQQTAAAQAEAERKQILQQQQQMATAIAAISSAIERLSASPSPTRVLHFPGIPAVTSPSTASAGLDATVAAAALKTLSRRDEKTASSHRLDEDDEFVPEHLDVLRRLPNYRWTKAATKEATEMRQALRALAAIATKLAAAPGAHIVDELADALLTANRTMTVAQASEVATLLQVTSAPAVTGPIDMSRAGLFEFFLLANRTLPDTAFARLRAARTVLADAPTEGVAIIARLPLRKN
jgi:hypothetical protein